MADGGDARQSVANVQRPSRPHLLRPWIPTSSSTFETSSTRVSRLSHELAMNIVVELMSPLDFVRADRQLHDL